MGQAIRAEYDRQQQNIELIASENIVSAAVLAAAGTVLTNKHFALRKRDIPPE